MTVLDTIRSEVAWAKQHIEYFQFELRKFEAERPYEVVSKPDLDRGKRVYYVAKAPDEIPAALAHIAKDILSNLRSPLDHVIAQLVLSEFASRNETKPDGWNPKFPISSGTAKDYKATVGGLIKSVRKEIIDAVLTAEAYKGGKGHCFWVLNELNNTGKHELLVGTLVAPAVDVSVDMKRIIDGMNISADFRNRMKRLTKPLFIAETPVRSNPKVGDEIYLEPLDLEPAHDRRFAFDVTLNAPGVVASEPALKTFQEITNLVSDTVESLGRFLP